MDHSFLLKQIMDILNIGGEDEDISNEAFRRYFEDPKIFIEGYVPDRRTRNYKTVKVGIKMIDKNMPTASVSLGVRKRTPDITMVSQYEASTPGGQLLLILFRPGRWLRYVEKLHSDWRDEQAYINRVHNTQIDDSELFPEFGDA